MAEFKVKCKGRDEQRNEVLEEAVKVTVNVTPSGESILSSSVECQYNTGSHGQRCKASHPEVDKQGKGIICPYSIDIPYAIDLYINNKNKQTI
ncbi:hypothetical protein GOV14_02155 [Candidatus Pacearchaeota archaeon]|nr:hypothetical protein [Candidatus Pacearchaeota archaeon]